MKSFPTPTSANDTISWDRIGKQDRTSRRRPAEEVRANPLVILAMASAATEVRVGLVISSRVCLGTVAALEVARDSGCAATMSRPRSRSLSRKHIAAGHAASAYK